MDERGRVESGTETESHARSNYRDKVEQLPRIIRSDNLPCC